MRTGRTSAAVAGLTLLALAGPHAQTAKRLALVGGMLLSGYEVPPVHHAAVVIEGNKIVAAGPASEIKIPGDATIVDTSGRVMLPGLIETHGHLVVLGHGSYDTWFPWIIGKGRELGTIEPGKLADIIVVSGNPLFDITALSHVEVVVKDGTIYKGGPSRPSSRSSSGR